ADGAADLDHADVRILGALEDRLLDLVRDMRDHLHGCAEILAAPLLRDHVRIDAACREIAVAAGLRAHEALVVPEIEIRFGAVLRHEHLAVLERTHRSGIDVDVRIELDQANLEPARLENRAETSGRDPFPERRHDAAGDENESGHTPPGRNAKKNAPALRRHSHTRKNDWCFGDGITTYQNGPGAASPRHEPRQSMRG